MDKYVLRQYKPLEKEIACLKNEIERLRESFLSPPNNDGLPRAKGRRDRITILVSRIIDLDNILSEKLSQMVDCRLEIEEALETLEAADRLLIRLRYIEGFDWDKIALELGYDKQGKNVYKRHNNIIRKLKDR